LNLIYICIKITKIMGTNIEKKYNNRMMLILFFNCIKNDFNYFQEYHLVNRKSNFLKNLI